MARDTKERTYKLLSGQMKRLALTEDALNEEIRIFSRTAAEKNGLFCKTSALGVTSSINNCRRQTMMTTKSMKMKILRI